MLAALARARPFRQQADIPPSLLDYAASALTDLIDSTRQQTIADGVRPIPSVIGRSLLGYFPAALLQKCRFATGTVATLTLPGLRFTYGDVTAVTLGDIVLFKLERSAETDLRLWAHELTHVVQFQRWGVDGFADHYVRDRAALEREANDNAARFVAWNNEQKGC